MGRLLKAIAVEGKTFPVGTEGLLIKFEGDLYFWPKGSCSEIPKIVWN